MQFLTVLNLTCGCSQSTSDIFDGVQADKIRADVADNLLERFRNQSETRPLLKAALAVLVSRLGPRFHAASSRPLMIPVLHTVIVENKLGRIDSNDQYLALRAASPQAEDVLLSKLQGTLQKNMGAIRKSMRDLVAEFWESELSNPEIDFVKEHVFGVEAGLPLMVKGHHHLAACFRVPCPSAKGTLISFVNEFPPCHPP